jgi:hypothetical protein
LEKNDTLADPAAQSNRIDAFLKIIATAKPSSDIPVIANNIRPDDLM